MKKYLVFYVKGGRIGSVEATDSNRREAHERMYLGLLQTDITGTEHYNVWGVRSNKGREARAAYYARSLRIGG